MILDGKKVSRSRNLILKNKIESDNNKGFKAPSIAIINVGENPASLTYIKAKKLAAQKVGIKAEIINFSRDIKEEELELQIKKINDNELIDGIIIQLPLPDSFDQIKFINMIDPSKDIDGFTSYNQGKLFQNQAAPRAATPQGIINLLKHYKIDVKGMNSVVIGASQIVGLPISKMLLDLEATVTTCHIETKDISIYTKTADLIVSAAGKVNLINSNMIKEGVVIIDVGMNRNNNNKLVGDVNFKEVFDKCSYITPVPNGVGPMTINALLENTYHLVKMKRETHTK